MKKVYNAKLVWQLHEDQLRDRVREKMLRLAAGYATGTILLTKGYNYEDIEKRAVSIVEEYRKNYGGYL